MRISRPCYDKPRRCPGWAGGGWLYPKRDRCDNGYLRNMYGGDRLPRTRWAWQFRFNQCPKCGVIVLPYAVRWLDWRHWRFVIVDKIGAGA